MSFAGPAEAAKAVWAHAVSSKKTGRVQSTWRPGKLLKPNQALPELILNKKESCFTGNSYVHTSSNVNRWFIR